MFCTTYVLLMKLLPLAVGETLVTMLSRVKLGVGVPRHVSALD